MVRLPTVLTCRSLAWDAYGAAAMSREIASRAVAWLSAEHGHALTRDTLWAPIGDAAVKAVCDISVLLLYRVLLLERPLDECYQPLSSSVMQIVESPLYAQTLRAHPRAVHLYGLPYAAARALGFDSSEARTALAEVIASGAPLQVERPPYQQLSLIHFLESIELSPPGLDAEAIAATALLARQPNPANLLSIDAYAIAHTVFYLTDFGRRPLTGLRQPMETTRDIVQRLLEKFLTDDDSDLTAELAGAVACLEPRLTTPILGALTRLSKLQRPDGTIARSVVLAPLRAGMSPFARRTWWFQHYHTVVVTALLATLVENRALGSLQPRSSWLAR